MNASQFMDKQIMELKTSSSLSFIDLMSSDETENTKKKKEEKEETILPSYDFHPIRPLSASLNLDSSVHSLPSSFPLQSYASLERVEQSKAVPGKENSNSSNSSILSEIDKTMKKHADNLLIVLEGVSSRLMQLETRTRHLETSVDDLKVSVGNNHGSMDGKMRQQENILREVQTGVQVLKDKQEIMETQLQLTKLQISKENQQDSEPQHVGGMDVIQQAASAPPHPLHHIPPTPVTYPTSVPSVAAPQPTVPPPMSQQNLAPPAPVAGQFHQSQLTPVPHQEPYYKPPVQIQESPSPQYAPVVSQQPHPQPPPAVPQHQPYLPAMQPQFLLPPKQHQPQTQPQPTLGHRLDEAQHQPYSPASQPQFPQPPQQHLPQPALGHHPEEASYAQTQSYTPSLSQPSSHQPTSAPPQQYYGTPTYEPPAIKPGSGVSTGYFPPSAGHNEPYPYSRLPSQYAGSAPMKTQHTASASSQGGGSGYPQLPTARILPQALPTASGVTGGSNSPSRVPLDDVVDKVTSMGFPGEHVRATVRKLTENGQAVDLNIVLDKLMNDEEIQPPRGWFGR